MNDHLTDQPTKHWSETSQPMTGLARIDGKTVRWMGTAPPHRQGVEEVPAMEQASLEVTLLHSRYVFRSAGVSSR